MKVSKKKAPKKAPYPFDRQALEAREIAEIQAKFDAFDALYSQYPSKRAIKRLSVRRKKMYHLAPYTEYCYQFLFKNPQLDHDFGEVGCGMDKIIDVVVGFDGFCVLGFDPNQTYDTYEILFTKEHRRKDTKSNELAGDEIFALAGFVGRVLRATECTITKHDAYWDVDTALETVTWKNES